MSDLIQEPEMTFRERLSLNAEEFDQIVDEILKENEGLKLYIDSGMSDNELVIEQKAQITRLEREVEKAYRQGHADGWKELEVEKGYQLFKKQLNEATDDKEYI